MQEQLNKLKIELLGALENIKDINALRDLEIMYLGRKGKITEILRGLANLPDDMKKIMSKEANQIKSDLQVRLDKIKKALSDGEEKRFVDITLPGRKIERGHLHPITAIQNELEDMFSSMGFMVLGGPELESDYFNFTALNIPAYHPARDMQDTFYIDDKNRSGESGFARTAEDKSDLVMRTHTSPVEVRAMKKYGAPLRCVIPGRVFRNENIDACHDTTFYQLEGLMIDRNISISNLISVLKEMLEGIFKQEIKTRVRPGYFPFVEPGIEVDMACMICGGRGCPSCKNTGWLEMIGAGMSHPNVLKAGGIDPDEFNGFAFGLGLTRLAMMKYGVNDIRLFNSGDLRFLEQF